MKAILEVQQLQQEIQLFQPSDDDQRARNLLLHGKFPTTTLEQLKEVDDKLKDDSEFYEALSTQLRKFKTKEMNTTCIAALRHLIHVDVASQMSWAGSVNKYAFTDYPHIIEIIRGICVGFNDANEKDVRRVMTNWFKNSARRMPTYSVT
uniref:DUF4806 domain-containing protein n=1 Tax=Cacopsylla melanoneura TaxID=428564 RepID=A0A8D8SZ58_9HEMI